MERRNPSIYLLALIAGITVGLCAFLLSPGSGTSLETEDFALDGQQAEGPNVARAVGEPSSAARAVGEPTGTSTSDSPPEALADVGTGNTVAAPATSITPEVDEDAPVLAAPAAEEAPQIVDAASRPARPDFSATVQNSSDAPTTTSNTAAPTTSQTPATTQTPTTQTPTTTTTRPPATTASPTTTRAPVPRPTTTTTTRPSTTTAAQRTGTPLLIADFQDTPTGSYSSNDVRSDFGAIDWAVTSRVNVVNQNGNRFLRVDFPRGKVGPSEGGAQFRTEFAESIGLHDELYLSYDVRFEGGFDFQLGGKLPGFASGTAVAGGDQPNGYDGFSTRMMWIEGGDAISYVYHPDKTHRFGDGMRWTDSSFTPGEWTTVETRVRLNTPGSNNGIIEGWMDGELVLRRTNLRFRDTADLQIEGLFFSTFFGGSTQEWAPSRDETIDFDNFVISQSPISH